MSSIIKDGKQNICKDQLGTIFSLIAKVVKAGKDCTIDKTAWANVGYEDVQGFIIGKLHASKDGQYTFCVDSHCHFIYAYTPRHKFFTCKNPFTQEGPAEVERLITSMRLLTKMNKKD